MEEGFSSSGARDLDFPGVGSVVGGDSDFQLAACTSDRIGSLLVGTGLIEKAFESGMGANTRCPLDCMLGGITV